MSETKIAGHVTFTEKDHSYNHTETAEKYTSVTTLIAQFSPKFKVDYWSLYKAIKDTLEPIGKWYALKKQAGGWEEVVKYFADYYLDITTLDERQVIANKQQWYKEKWAKEGAEAGIRGSIIHAELEGAAYTAQQIQEDEVNYNVTQEDILQIQDFTTNKAYPELLLYNDFYMVAGQVDLVTKRGKQVIISDYKTCKEITKISFNGEMMYDPVAHLPNANYYKFCLQLSMYGFMLEKLGYEVIGLNLFWIHGKNKEDKQRNAGVKTYNLPYLKQEVLSILEAKSRL